MVWCGGVSLYVVVVRFMDWWCVMQIFLPDDSRSGRTDVADPSTDVEMKDRSIPSNFVSSPAPSTLQHLREIASLIETGSYSKEVRRITRVVRLTIVLRRKLTLSIISSFLDHVLTPNSEAHAKLSTYLPKEDDHEMEVDAATSAIQTPAKHLFPEIEIYYNLLVLLFLVDKKEYNEAKACSSASIVWLKNTNRRTVDVIASRLYFYYSYSYELTRDLA